MNKKYTITKFLKLLALSFAGTLLGSFLFHYSVYGIPVNGSIKDIERIESITISQEEQAIKITDREEISEAVLFTNFLYIKIGEAEKFEPTTEYLVKLKSGEIISIGTDDKYIAKNGKFYKGNEEYLKTFYKVVKILL